MTDGPAVLELRGVKKSYAGQAAVAGVDLALFRHSTFTLSLCSSTTPCSRT